MGGSAAGADRERRGVKNAAPAAEEKGKSSSTPEVLAQRAH
jgi:hypothetical protein